MQTGEDGEHLLTAACCKDYLVYDYETNRYTYRGVLTPRDM
jgi:hypothetical protein